MQQVLRYSIKHQKHYIAKVYSKVIHDEWLKKNGKDKFHVTMELINDNKVEEYVISLTKLYYGNEERVDSRSFFFVDRFKDKWSAIQQLSHILEAIKRGVLK